MEALFYLIKTHTMSQQKILWILAISLLVTETLWACSCAGVASFCDATNLNSLVVRGRMTDQCLYEPLYDDDNNGDISQFYGACLFEVTEVIYGSIIIDSTSGIYANTDSTIWIGQGESSFCVGSYPVTPDGAEWIITLSNYEEGSISFAPAYQSIICNNDLLQYEDGMVTGYLTESFFYYPPEVEIDVLTYDAFLETLGSCTGLPIVPKTCESLEVWDGVECSFEICGAEYQVALSFLNGVEEAPYTIINEVTDDTTVITTDLYLSDMMPSGTYYHYTVYSNATPNCQQTIWEDPIDCFEKEGESSENYGGMAENDFYIVEVGDTLFFNPLDNDICVGSCVFSFGAADGLDNYGEVIFASYFPDNESCTMAYVPSGAYCGPILFKYYYRDTNNDNVEGYAQINVECVLEGVTFGEDFLGCNDIEDTYDFLITLKVDSLDSIPPMYEYQFCGTDDWMEVTFYEGEQQGFIYVPDTPQSSGFCVEVREVNNPSVVQFIEVPDYACLTTELDLLSFKGNATPQGKQIEWQTATETENAYFVLERSYDGYGFEAIQKVEGAGNSNTRLSYEYLDKTAANQMAYYRLQAIDTKGVMEVVSSVVSVERVGEGNAMSLYPNPAKDVVNVYYTSEDVQKLELKVFDITSNLVRHQTVIGNKGSNLLQLNVNDFPKGLYFVELSGDGEPLMKRLVID